MSAFKKRSAVRHLEAIRSLCALFELHIDEASVRRLPAGAL